MTHYFFLHIGRVKGSTQTRETHDFPVGFPPSLTMNAFRKLPRSISFAAALVLCTAFAHGEVVESDIVVFGGTSGGVAAAVQARRMGKSAVIAEWLNFFVLIAQLFEKVPPLHQLAPTNSEGPFKAAQLTALVLFVVLGFLATKNFRHAQLQSV